MARDELKALKVAVLGGAGPSAERIFTAGVAAGPLSLGRQGDWAIEGRGVGALDGFLYFDGRELFACSRDATTPMMLDGRPLGATWERVPMGAILALGRTRLVVEDPVPPPNSSATIITDFEAMKAPPVPAAVASPPTKNPSRPPGRPSPAPARASAPPPARPLPSGGLFSSDEENTRIGEVLAPVVDGDDAPTAFLSSSVRDAVREGLARASHVATLPPPELNPSPRPPAARPGSPRVPGPPTHVLRVDTRTAPFPASPQPPPAPPSEGVAGGAFFAPDAGVGPSPSVDRESLPRLSESMPLYGVRGAPRGPITEPPRADAVPVSLGARLGRFWAEAPPVRKAAIALSPAALLALAFVLVGTSPQSPSGVPASGVREVAPSAVVPSSPPATVAVPPPSTGLGASAFEGEPVTPRVIGASIGLARAPDGGVTLERRAADAVHAHRLDEAAALYRELRVFDPRNAAFGAASAVLAQGQAPAR